MWLSKLKKLILVLLLLLAVFWGYVEIINVNLKNMTMRQKILKTIYPVFAWLAKAGGRNGKELSNESVKPVVSIYSLKGTLNDGGELNFDSLKGKKILLVNTASDCGYTPQYAELQKLYEEKKGKLVILGFPANDFKEQEKGSDNEIAEFCKANYGISFPLMKKSTVIKGNNQNEIFKWLSDKTRNGWNSQQPTWNFSKYLINETGILTNYFAPSVSPLSKEVLTGIEK
jgi:glutathione peroxidase